MNKTQPTPWSPPSAERLTDHLAAYPPSPGSVWVARAPLFILGFAVAIAVGVGGALGLMLPWLAVMGVMVYGVVRVRRMRTLEARVGRVQELAMLRHYREALDQAWTLVQDLTPYPALQHRAVSVLAHCLDDTGAHDAAIVTYDRLLDDLPADHPGALLLRVQRVIAELFTDRLADADYALRKLRSSVEPYEDTPVGAAYHFASLFQAVRTAHYAEAIEESADLVQTLRPLGIEAGYGHALRAWCHSQCEQSEEAGRWWDRATALLPAGVLVARFPELKGMPHD